MLEKLILINVKASNQRTSYRCSVGCFVLFRLETMSALRPESMDCDGARPKKTPRTTGSGSGGQHSTAAGASSSGNQQGSGGAHAASSDADSLTDLKCFDAEDFKYFGVRVDDATENDVRRSYLEKCKIIDPGKGGCSKAFKQLQFLYEKVREGFKVLAELQKTYPNATVGSVTKATIGSLGPVSEEIAPGYNAKRILRKSRVAPLISEAVRDIVPYLDVKPEDLHDALRNLRIGEEYTCELRGVTQPDRYSCRYHGTSWLGCKEIVKSKRILPSYGAGGHWKDYGAKPLVYTSIDTSCAGRYPTAMLDRRNNLCGEVVAGDTKYLRVRLTCNVDMSKREVKLRRRGKNSQDAFPQECVEVTAVTFCAFGTAPQVQLKHYKLTDSYDESSDDGSDSYDESSDDEADELHLERVVQCTLMSMRRKENDLRSQSTVAEAVLKLLEVRALVIGYRGVFEDTYRTPPGVVMTVEQMRKAHNVTLRGLFEEDKHDHTQTDAGLARRWKLRRNHGRFRTWLFVRFGDKEGRKELLKHGCPADVIRRLEKIVKNG